MIIELLVFKKLLHSFEIIPEFASCLLDYFFGEGINRNCIFYDPFSLPDCAVVFWWGEGNVFPSITFGGTASPEQVNCLSDRVIQTPLDCTKL